LSASANIGINTVVTMSRAAQTTNLSPQQPASGQPASEQPPPELEQSSLPQPPLPRRADIAPEVAKAIARYLKLEDEIKHSCKDMRTQRGELRELHNMIAAYMLSNGIERLTVRHGENRLELRHRERHLRPTRDTMLECLRTANVADPERLVELLRQSGGTAEEWRLARRNAASVARPPRRAVPAQPAVSVPSDSSASSSSTAPAQASASGSSR
jgi:hypothetical protein